MCVVFCCLSFVRCVSLKNYGLFWTSYHFNFPFFFLSHLLILVETLWLRMTRYTFTSFQFNPCVCGVYNIEIHLYNIEDNVSSKTFVVVVVVVDNSIGFIAAIYFWAVLSLLHIWKFLVWKTPIYFDNIQRKFDQKKSTAFNEFCIEFSLSRSCSY